MTPITYLTAIDDKAQTWWENYRRQMEYNPAVPRQRWAGRRPASR